MLFCLTLRLLLVVLRLKVAFYCGAIARKKDPLLALVVPSGDPNRPPFAATFAATTRPELAPLRAETVVHIDTVADDPKPTDDEIDDIGGGAPELLQKDAVPDMTIPVDPLPLSDGVKLPRRAPSLGGSKLALAMVSLGRSKLPLAKCELPLGRSKLPLGPEP